MRTLTPAALNLIETFEGCVLHPYRDSTGLPTIGIGTIHYPNGAPVTMADPPITHDQAVEYLQSHLSKNCDEVSQLVTICINDNQFGALVSFVYNLGSGALSSSTLLRKVNSGDFEGAAEEFIKWNHAGGVVSAGLTRRRQAEQALFQHPVDL
jgi:lysozyme